MNWIKASLLVFCFLLEVVSLNAQGKFRTERDLLGERQFRAEAYYAIQTAREGLAAIESQALIFRTSLAIRGNCGDGITVNEKTIERYMETTVGIVTALNPIVGYERASELAVEAYKSGKGILELVREQKILSEVQIQQLLDPAKLTGLDKSKYQNP